MNITVAVALLVMLLVYIGETPRAAQSAPKRSEADDHAWIDELENLDAMTDDFI